MQSQCAFDDDDIASRQEEAFKRSSGVEAVALKTLQRKATVPAATTLSTTSDGARVNEDGALPLFVRAVVRGLSIAKMPRTKTEQETRLLTSAADKSRSRESRVVAGAGSTGSTRADKGNAKEGKSNVVAGTNEANRFEGAFVD
jgi:hypothetical protein